MIQMASFSKSTGESVSRKPTNGTGYGTVSKARFSSIHLHPVYFPFFLESPALAFTIWSRKAHKENQPLKKNKKKPNKCSNINSPHTKHILQRIITFKLQCTNGSRTYNTQREHTHKKSKLHIHIHTQLEPTVTICSLVLSLSIISPFNGIKIRLTTGQM